MPNLDDTIRDKLQTNGHFGDMSALAQGLKFALRRGKNWEQLAPGPKEALEQIQTRVAMILTGDPNDAGHWNKLAMVARLVAKDLEPLRSNRIAEINRAREAAGVKLLDPAQVEEEQS